MANVSEGEAAPEGARPRRRLTQAEAKERTRQQLVAAAARVFALKGFAGASLEEIAEAAGYSTGAVYYNFAGKEELFLELIRSGWSRQIERRTEAVTRVFAEAAAHGGDPFDALSAFLAGRAGQGSDVSPLVAEFWLYAVRHPEVMDLVAAKLSEQDRGLEPVIAAAMERYGTPDAAGQLAASRLAQVVQPGQRQALRLVHGDLRTVDQDWRVPWRHHDVRHELVTHHVRPGQAPCP
jgi:AcrR family transcriptional regulator